MKKIFMILIIFILPANIFTQEDAYVISQQRWIKILPVMQSFSIEDENISEMSIPFQVYLPLTRSMSISLNTIQASAYGDNYTSLNGFGDTQIAINYYFEKQRTIFNLGLNLPSGRKELTIEEFETSTALSWDQLNFRVPGFGQGLNITTGIVWAFPASEKLVFGFGASYQYKGSYKSFKDIDDTYNPGDEILLTTGFDIRYSETMTFSSDFIFTTYGEDKVGDESVFASGNKLLAVLLFKKYFGYHDLRLLARYRSKGKNELAVSGELVEEENKTTADQLELLATFRWHYSRYLATTFLIERRSFEQTNAYDGLIKYGLGIGPQISLSKKFQIPLRIMYISGKYDSGTSLNGLEGAVGLIIGF